MQVDRHRPGSGVSNIDREPNLDGANLSNARLARCNLDLTLMRGTVLAKADQEAATFDS